MRHRWLFVGTWVAMVEGAGIVLDAGVHWRHWWVLLIILPVVAFVGWIAEWL